MSMTHASLFSGFDGVGVGAKAAGMELAWGIEIDPALAEVGNFNLGNHIKVADILDCNPFDFERVDVLHASTVCTEFSAAKTNGKESALDIACAAKTAEFVTVLQPEIFTLENVMAYRKSKSWALIEDALHKAGYWLNIEICNSANYGVPQTRKRMIVRAIKGGFVPYLPHPEPWIGWYAAIEDLIPTLPDSQFAPWQLARLKPELRTTLVCNGGFDGNVVTVGIKEPSFIITGGMMGRAKAFLVGKQYDSPNSNLDRSVQTRMGDEPSLTVVTRTGDTKAFDGGRVVAMTTRCLARFQSFPDSYILPESKTLAAKGIGNAVPPLMMEKIYRGLQS